MVSHSATDTIFPGSTSVLIFQLRDDGFAKGHTASPADRSSVTFATNNSTFSSLGIYAALTTVGAPASDRCQITCVTLYNPKPFLLCLVSQGLFNIPRW